MCSLRAAWRKFGKTYLGTAGSNGDSEYRGCGSHNSMGTLSLELDLPVEQRVGSVRAHWALRNCTPHGTKTADHFFGVSLGGPLLGGHAFVHCFSLIVSC